MTRHPTRSEPAGLPRLDHALLNTPSAVPPTLGSSCPRRPARARRIPSICRQRAGWSPEVGEVPRPESEDRGTAASRQYLRLPRHDPRSDRAGRALLRRLGHHQRRRGQPQCHSVGVRGRRRTRGRRERPHGCSGQANARRPPSRPVRRPRRGRRSRPGTSSAPPTNLPRCGTGWSSVRPAQSLAVLSVRRQDLLSERQEASLAA